MENNEVPEVSEPTRVMPTIGKSPKKPKLKPEKKRQLLLFYGSIGAIVVLLVIFFLVIFKSCSGAKGNSSVFSFASNSEESILSSEQSAVSLPSYNSVIESSPPVSSAAASSQTVSVPTIMPASKYLSFTLADLKNNFGAISGSEENEGGGSILSFSGCSYKFIINTETPTDSDRVSSVIVSKGGEIISGASVGQTYIQIYSKFSTPFQFVYDENEEVAVASTKYNNATYYIYFEKEDKNVPSLSALIKLD